MKRLLDAGAALCGLVLLAPLFALLALLVWASDGRPIFFGQTRVGRSGRPFRMWKFRTMVRDAERHGGQLTVGGDPRVTRLGAWLRRSKLDELPQLANVLLGEMSLVGPRPEVPHYVAQYTRDQRRVLRFQPGITDPASLAFADESTLLAAAPDPERAYVKEVMPEKLRQNLAYADRATVWTDLLVILRTIARLPSLAVATGDPARARRPRHRLVAALLRRRRPIIVGLHVALACAGFLVAAALHHDFVVPAARWPRYLAALPLVVLVRLAMFGRYGLFRGYWQHFGFDDALNTIKAASASTVATVALLLAAAPAFLPPTRLLLLDWLLAVGSVGGVHIAARSLREGHFSLRQRPGRRTVIIGAGEAAERLLRQFRHDVALDVNPVALLDDAPHKVGRVLHGVPVVGTSRDLARAVERHNASFVVIAIPSAGRRTMRRLVEGCLATGLEFRVIRPLRELMDGRTPTTPLRAVELEDLLGRAPVRLDARPLQRDFAEACVLITGGAGSIGSELARQVAALRPRRLVLLDQAESPLHGMRLELAASHPELDVVPVIASVTDEMRLAAVFAAHRPTHVFHTAAYKHVPLMEEHALEAVRNNVFGTLRTAQAAVRAGVRRFVLLSTDKAVYPSSVMGATKRMAERVLLELPELAAAPTDFRAVRFGNVLGSDGSVVPTFRRQLAEGGPLTVTDPEVTRYFMTIPEAVQLVLQAMTLDEAAGRIAMLDMGEPVRIVELAENLIRLSGLEPYVDVPIRFTGLRPGEKLHEDLMAAYEQCRPTRLPQIRTVQTAEPKALSIALVLDRLAAALVTGSTTDALRALCAGVPECTPPLRDAAAVAGVPSLADLLPPRAGARSRGGASPDGPPAGLHPS